MFISKKYQIKISTNIKIIYCQKKRRLTIIGPINTKSLKLNIKLRILETEKTIIVTSNPISVISNNQKKQLKALKGTTVALIKQSILETYAVFYQKLKFVGVGYRAFDVTEFKHQLVMFKVGYSHPLYFKIPKNITVFCLKLTRLFIYGMSYQNVKQTASIIQSYKSPEPYKGKGILYNNEKITLKEGKKV
jgi:large subunit ribosomal protein L6